MPPKSPPKGKKKKKTKEELEEERRQAEEAARLAEEERKRLEEEERQRLAELERQRQELLGVLLGQEAERVASENVELEPLTGQQRLERSKAEEDRRAAWEWERFTACTYVPHPKDRVSMSDFVTASQAAQDTVLAEAFTACQDCYSMLDEANAFRLSAFLVADEAGEAMHTKDMATLHEIVGGRIDRVTAHILHHSDEFASERGDVQLGTQQGAFKWAVWVNTSKNPRLKAVELPQLQMIVEIPKQIALANIALRVVHKDKDEFFPRCTNEYMAVGGVLYVDLLALPPPAKHIKNWTLRQVTPLSSNVSRIPYPIPPAGADPATYRSEEEPPALGFALPFTPNMVLLDDAVKVGWWDAETSSWSTVGVSDASVDAASNSLSFHSNRMGPLAVLQARTRLMPYQSWNVRPTGGRNGSTAAVTLHVGLPEPLLFEVAPGTATFVSPALPALVAAGLVGKALPPETLLSALSAHGLHLLPEERDAGAAGVVVKERGVEAAMCREVAALGGAFLVARAKWNQAPGGAGSQECIARISEVLDWEEGGRTEARHLDRIFTKEKEDGERRVLAVIQRGDRGVAFIDALDKREAYPALPGHESVESVQACMGTVWGEVHASLLSLLKGSLVAPDVQGDSPLAQRLQAAPETLELVRTTNALFTQSLAQLLMLLRVFSFS